MKKTHALCGAALLGCTVLTTAKSAESADCSTYTNPVYIGGSTAVQPLLQSIAMPLSQANPAVSLIYQSVGSCVGVSDITTPSPEKATANYIAPDGTLTACTFPPTGINLDIGVSDVYATTCGGMVPMGLKDFYGPNQVMTFVVPLASTETSISADAAYTVFGFGGGMYPVNPWTDPTYYFIRKPTSGVINMISKATGLAPAKWMGVQEANGSNGVLADLTGMGATMANKAIGILATDLADSNRDKIKILAYQHTMQECGYLPDSDATHFDKINVRQGRYAIWGPLHLITAVDGNGNPMSANVGSVINYFTGSNVTAAQEQTILDAEIKAHVVPQCAMQVSRMDEDGAEASYQPPVPCGCYFDSKVGSAPASCKTCNGDGDCSGGTPKCRYGYCEVQ